MPARHTTTNIRKVFKDYLGSQDISKISIKNYISDINHFSSWFIFKIKTWGASPETLSETIPFITKGTASKYKSFLIKKNISSKTINRRLSTLRHFGRFLYSIESLDYNFAKNIKNTKSTDKKSKIGSLISQFEQHLINEKVSRNTVKSYLSDTRQFLNWLEQK